jgi:hypothetical protein
MDHSVTLKDTDQRVRYTLESIEKWLNLGNDLRLVICDGSGYDFSAILKGRFPARPIECLSFENDKRLVEQHGKGYGEGEIIKYALQHSTLLRRSTWFAKCTAKLWVDNFFECLEEWNRIFLCKAFFSNVFSFKKTKFEYIDTRFYLSDKDVYFKYFSDTHLKVGGVYGTSIEDNFKAIVLENCLQHLLFRSTPVIRGVGGASGKYYRNNRIRRMKEILRSKIVQYNPEFSGLFNRVRQD